MHSLVRYNAENEYDDVANIRVNNYSTSTDYRIQNMEYSNTENENFHDIKNLRFKVNFWIVSFSIIILINIFLLGYIAMSLIFLSNNQNGNFLFSIP